MGYVLISFSERQHSAHLLCFIGFGVFAILIPGSAFVIITILSWSQIKASRLGLVRSYSPQEEVHHRTVAEKVSFGKKVVTALVEMDAIGLLLFTAGWTCLILPLNLAK